MNQEQNNINQNFNMQGNNETVNNQTFNNQNIGLNQQATPNYQQPINQMNMQSPTPQTTNNTFVSGNTNTQSVNSKPPKKIKFGLIIGLFVTAIAICAILLLSGKPKQDTNDKQGLEEKGQEKTQIYLNENCKTKDKVSYIIKETYSDDTPYVFIGIKEDGIASDLTPDTSTFNNDVAKYSNANTTEFSLYIGNEYLHFDSEKESYNTKENQTQEFINDQLVLFKSDGYYITTSNIDKYILYYKLKESMYDGLIKGELHGTWDVLLIGFYDTQEEAKNRIESLQNFVDICTYQEDEGIENCKNFDNKIINYKEYRNLNDMLLEMLKQYGLYVESYEKIYTSHGEIRIFSDSTTSKISNEFKLDFKSGTINTEGYKEFELNGNKFYIKDEDIISEKNGVILDFYVDLPYDVEETEENIINEFKSAFSKYKNK